jgi:hypothetical protein
MWMRILTDALGMMMFTKNRHQQRTGRKQEKSTLPQLPALFIFVRPETIHSPAQAGG